MCEKCYVLAQLNAFKYTEVFDTPYITFTFVRQLCDNADKAKYHTLLNMPACILFCCMCSKSKSFIWFTRNCS